MEVPGIVWMRCSLAQAVDIFKGALLTAELKGACMATDNPQPFHHFRRLFNGWALYIHIYLFICYLLFFLFSRWGLVMKAFSLLLCFHPVSLSFIRPLPAFLSHISFHFLKTSVLKYSSMLQVPVFQFTSSLDASASFMHCEWKGLKCLSTVHMIQFHLNKSNFCPAEVQEISTSNIYLLTHQKILSWRKAKEIRIIEREQRE